MSKTFRKHNEKASQGLLNNYPQMAGASPRLKTKNLIVGLDRPRAERKKAIIHT